MLIDLLRQFLIIDGLLPANPVSLVLYVFIAFYGVYRIRKLNIYKGRLGFIKSVGTAILALVFIEFNMDNLWWITNFLRFGFPIDKFITFIERNSVYVVISLIVLKDLIPQGHIFFDKKTLLGFALLELFFILWSWLSPSYAYVDWAYALINDFPDQVAIIAFTISCLGKSIVAYTYSTLWR